MLRASAFRARAYADGFAGAVALIREQFAGQGPNLERYADRLLAYVAGTEARANGWQLAVAEATRRL